jgi:hypothetical protein
MLSMTLLEVRPPLTLLSFLFTPHFTSPSPQRSGAALPPRGNLYPALLVAHNKILVAARKLFFSSSPTSQCMALPQHGNQGQQRSLIAAGVSPPLFDVPTRDNTTTPDPSGTTDHTVVEDSFLDPGDESEQIVEDPSSNPEDESRRTGSPAASPKFLE